MDNKEVSPRVALGLTAAEQGDIRGVEKFLRFVHRECQLLSICFDLPEGLRGRVVAVGREAELVACFADGYAQISEEAKHQAQATRR